MNRYLIRFNTQHNGSNLVWRVFENDKEFLVKNIHVTVPVTGQTSVEAGIEKWNIACSGRMHIEDDIAYIR